jgi:hypothetical protein
MTRRRWAILGLVTPLGIVSLGLALTRPLAALSREVPVTVGARAESTSSDTLVLAITGPTGAGKPAGTTITGRITPETRFVGLRRGEAIGPTVPLVITFDDRPNTDGSYRLLAIAAQVR